MQLTGKLIHILPLQTGQGKNGEWKKQDVVVEIPGTYPKKLCFSMWGDKINESVLQIGNDLDINFDVESREYNGKWYTDVKAWKVTLAGANPGAPSPTNYADGETTFTSDEDDTDLPF